jgi:hypothetical protein
VPRVSADGDNLIFDISSICGVYVVLHAIQLMCLHLMPS